MNRRPVLIAVFLLGTLSLAMVSCRESKQIESVFTKKELIAESHFGFSKPGVSLVVEGGDDELRRDIEKCLLSGLRKVPGVTLVTSDPLYKVEVLILPVGNDVTVSVVVLEISSSCPRCLTAHHILFGDKAALEALCRRIVDSFEKELVAPFRKNEANPSSSSRVGEPKRKIQ